MFNRVGSGEAFVIGEVTNAIKEEPYSGPQLLGRTFMWRWKEGGLEDVRLEARGVSVRRLVQ